MNTPAAIIWIPLEGQPHVVLDVISDGEAARLLDWIESHPDLRPLLDQIEALAEELEQRMRL